MDMNRHGKSARLKQEAQEAIERGETVWFVYPDGIILDQNGRLIPPPLPLERKET